MNVYQTTLSTGITRTREFERKGLASFAVNVGTKCGHDCLYCSTGALLRMHRSFKDAGQNPFGHGYAIVDPDTPTRVAADARRIRNPGLVQLCTVVDAWAPEAHAHRLGRKCLEAILSQPGWTVRILTKNAAVREDFDLIERYRDRVLIGLSTTGLEDAAQVLAAVEPYASPITERMAVMREAAARGFRMYGMLCPLIPGIADAEDQINRLVQFTVECRVEEVFVEPINARGPGLRLTQEAIEAIGQPVMAAAVQAIRRREQWSHYVLDLLRKIQNALRRHSSIEKLRFLLYPSALLPDDLLAIRQDDAGVVWLGKD
jgi:DNA repair photolyase